MLAALLAAGCGVRREELGEIVTDLPPPASKSAAAEDPQGADKRSPSGGEAGDAKSPAADAPR